MAVFGTSGRLCKWPGVYPGNNESAVIVVYSRNLKISRP
jgi:hypothetical protein